MFLTDMLSEMSGGVVRGQLEKIKDDPAKYDKILQLTLMGSELGIVFLRESQEFREAFAKLHAEFLKYPESREVIRESLKAYSEYTH